MARAVRPYLTRNPLLLDHILVHLTMAVQYQSGIVLPQDLPTCDWDRDKLMLGVLKGLNRRELTTQVEIKLGELEGSWSY